MFYKTLKTVRRGASAAELVRCVRLLASACGRWRRGAEARERACMTDKLVASTRLHAPLRPVYLHACWKQAMSIRCHAE